MAPTVVPVSEIDRLISEAHRALGAARTLFARSPSGAAATACQAAGERLDELLGVRLDRMRESDRELVLRWVAQQSLGSP